MAQSRRVELTGDVEVEIELVGFDSRFEVAVEIIGEVGRRVGAVTETLEVGFEFGETRDILARVAT